MAIRDAPALPRDPVATLAAAAVECMPFGIACVDDDLRVVMANPALTAVLDVEAGSALGAGPEPRGRIAACARDVLAAGGAAELELGGALGRVFVCALDEDHASVIVTGPVTAGRPAEEQAAIRRVAMLVAKEAPEEVLFAAACEQVARLLGAEAAGVLRFEGGQRAVVKGVWRQGGTRGLPVNAELDFEPANSALGRAQSTRRPARVEGYEGHRGELPLFMRAIGLRSSVAAPVMLEGDVWGALVASTTRDEPLPAESEVRLATFADLIGQALANREARRRLAASRLRLVEAADEARRRLEGGLHEGAHQHVVALLLKLRVARARADLESPVAALIDDCMAEADEVRAALHELARGLHPAVLSERGLAPALQSLVARSAVPVHLRRLPAGRFAPRIETTAYFIVEEALANAERHARAGEVAVLAEDRGDRLVVEVRDDGTGGADPAAGQGLRALADRAAAVGGYLEVRSPDGGGTVVRAEFPVER